LQKTPGHCQFVSAYDRVSRKDNFVEAIEYTRWPRKCIASRDSVGIYRSLYSRADIFAEHDLHDSAIYYFDAALKIVESIKDSVGINEFNQRLGVAYQAKRDYSRAEGYFRKRISWRHEEDTPALASANKYLAPLKKTE